MMSGSRHSAGPIRRPSGLSAKSRAAPLLLFAAVQLASTVAGSDETLQHREMLLFEDPSVTAAARHVQSTRDAPARVTVISHADIERFGYRTLAEALRSVAGFYTSSDRAYDQIGVRGFLRPNDFNDRILLLVNGHTYNNDIYQQAYVGQDFGIDLEAVDRIEIIRGPGSALYGGNAFFAVINVVTRSGRDSPGINALVETGSFARKRGQASAGYVTEGGIDVFASGSVFDTDGPEALFYPPYDSPATNHGIAHNADAERALKFFASARSNGLFFQVGTDSREQHIPTGAYGTTFDDNGTKTRDARHFAEISYDGELPGETEIAARLFYDGMEYHGTYVYGAGRTRLKNEDLGTSNSLGAAIQARREVFLGNALTIGADYTYHPDATQQNFDLPSGRTILDDSRSFSTVGVYLQDEWQIVRNVSLVAGLRYDSYYGRLQQVSPRAGVVWNAARRTTIKLLFGQAFRPPNLYELYYAYPSIGIQSIANPRLGAEHITTYEAILEQGLWGFAEATVAAYHYDIHDLIEQVRVPQPSFDGTTLQFRNVGAAVANGADIECHVPLPRGAIARTAYSIQDARDQNDHVLSNSPRHLGSAELWMPLVSGFEGAVEFVVVGPRRTAAGRRLEVAHILNLNLTYRTPIDGLRLSAGLYNLLNQSYPDPGGPELRQDRIPQDGLTFRVQVRYAF
jgi:iron complex outermembrane receptor protein